MKLLLAATDRAAQEFYEKYRTTFTEDVIIVKSVRTLEGLRFRYEDVVRVSGWSKRFDAEEIEDRILRTHITSRPQSLHYLERDGVDWDPDANLPTYTRDFLKMIKEGELEYEICTYGTVTH